MKPADRAWCAIGVFVVIYNVAAKDGETLSEGADRYMLSHRRLTLSVALTVVAHVCNFVSPRFDIVHLTFGAIRRIRRWDRRGRKPRVPRDCPD